jgi:D-amino-acid dehydrogenase
MLAPASSQAFPRKIDVIVLGGGIIGTSLALALQMRGRATALIDRRAPGGETSFGNAGLIQREAIFPYAFPRDPLLLLQYALNLKPEAHYHLADLFSVAPFLWRYFRASSAAGQQKTARANAPLYEICLSEHRKLAQESGVEAMLRPGGWIKAFRSEKKFAEERLKAEVDLVPFDISSEILDSKGLLALEPNLSEGMIGAVHWKDPYSIGDPEALTLAYARQFEALGGAFLVGDAASLEQSSKDWTVITEAGRVSAKDCVVALGPWAPDLLRPLGYDVPMGVKRGYHIHIKPAGNATLNHPLLDADIGYMLAPMAKGIRLTTGAEFAHRDSPPTPIQIEKIEPYARALLPLAERVETTPWFGRRPCLPDMLPVMGKAPRHAGLWFNFGHAHHGLTLAGSAARLLAEEITGETPFTDPKPYGLERFSR